MEPADESPGGAGAVVDVRQEHLCCSLHWSCEGHKVDLDLSALLVTASGCVVQDVDGRLQSQSVHVYDQWRSCGVWHAGDTDAVHEGREQITLKLDLLTPQEVVDFIFVTVAVRGDQKTFRDIANIDAHLLAAAEDGADEGIGRRPFCAAELSQDPKLAESQGAIVAILSRGPNRRNWFVVWLQAPLSTRYVPQETVNGFIQHAQERIREEARRAEEDHPARHPEYPLLEPCSGSAHGGAQVRWIGGEPAPWELSIGGRPCAGLADGAFVVPMCRGIPGAQRVVALRRDGVESEYYAAFSYWEPGQFLVVEPARGPVTGGQKFWITTTDLGAPISSVLIDGTPCSFASAPSTHAVEVVLPPRDAHGPATIVVNADNGNAASSLPDSFEYYVPQIFGRVGQSIELSDERRTATRASGTVVHGVCLGAFPLRRLPQGRYFELIIERVEKGVRTLAVGVSTKQDDLIMYGGRIRKEEARELDSVWLAGYERGGAQFAYNGCTEKIPVAAWRPVKDVTAGSRIGVLWAEPEGDRGTRPALVIFQDGVERARLRDTGCVSSWEEELYALVDVQGSVTSVSLVEDASLPPSFSIS